MKTTFWLAAALSALLSSTGCGGGSTGNRTDGGAPDDAGLDGGGSDAAEGTACETPGNLLANPSFEDGDTAPEGWVVWPEAAPGVTYLWDDTAAASGQRSVSVASTLADGFGRWRQVVPVSSGVVYRVSGFVRFQDVAPPGRCNLQVVFRDSAGAVVRMVDLPGHGETRAFAHDFPRELKVRAPQGATIAEINLLLVGQGRAWFDDVFFGRAPAGEIAGTVTSGGAPLGGARVAVWNEP
ncbi:MAG: hypothetical protein HY906_27910, partial [Deltaproteobacteria bacterium]|nr:hypothetical protein [Deltaproteobacteria bacterium]